MALTNEDVRHVARLARLALDDAEVTKMTQDLAGILDNIGKIRELDLEGVQPTTHALDVTNAMAADVPHVSLSREDALLNAPDPADGTFRVPKMRA
jgi:aspartyl-tRNA(Asn)/glutamyl-tRNA(Gln) amidotransferase subunit C